jgi:hypothetical protein
MHYQEAVSITPNSAGNLLFVFCPGGQILGNSCLFSYYNGATLTDGTLGTITNGTTNPFSSGSGKPVTGFGKRVVSASLEVLSMASALNQTGILTMTSFPHSATGADTYWAVWDNLRDAQGAQFFKSQEGGR